MDAWRNSRSDSRCPIAIVGLGCVFPGAPDVETFWRNVLDGRSAISAVPPDRWDAEAFYDADPDIQDRTYCKVGGFVQDWRFDGRAFRVPPAAARVMDRAQQFALTAAQQAFLHAGLGGKPFDRDRAAVIFGIAGGRFENEEQVIQRVQWPLLERLLRDGFDRHGIPADRRESLTAACREEYLRGLVAVTEDTFAGLCPNVTAGRVASFLDLHGPSYVVDAACASSLAAVDCAIDSLRNGDVDLAVCGGVHAHMGLSPFIGFSKFHGLSPERISPFDEAADGFLLGEGAGCFVLKRLDDALRDDDRVFAVIRGIGSSSDGREKGIGAPTPRAQALAIRRAFDEAGYSPATVQLIEAHGVGTAVGDPAELEATHEVFGPQLSPGQRVVVTAVKSQVGHLMGAAGAAGLMKTVLGLHHEVMAPTIHHTRPNPAIPWDTFPFEILTAPRPWAPNRDGLPRRANLSSFGFGGNNFHVALEAFDPRWHQPGEPAPAPPPREPIAIVGLGACLPGSPDVETFWNNIVHQVSAIDAVPSDRWDGRAALFVDRDPDAPDRSHTSLGGFATSPALDARRLRVSPASMPHIDPGVKQLMASAVSAIGSTEILASPERRQRTAVIVGDSGGCREVLWSQVSRVAARRAETSFHRAVARTGGLLPAESTQAIAADLVRDMTAGRPAITEDSIVGIATSIGAARITKSLDLMGTHMAVDAACGSSLAAVTLAVRGLQSNKWDAVITGGVAGGFTPHVAVLASKARALSATGSRPFDTHADGFVPGEGSVAFVLKRLSDAIRDGDRVHGVIRGVGASTDGRGHSMYAPDSSRQALALSRAYADAALDPASVQYVECHATSTAVGDAAELQALGQVFGARAERSLGLGSVKAQIGHTMAAAGAAGLLKTLLGIERKTLPPMPAVAEPIAGAAGRSPFHLVTTAAPWTAPTTGEPRRAAVNAFGFGGTNWHVVVEEYVPAYHEALLARLSSPPPPGMEHVFIAAGATPEDLNASIEGLDPDGQRRRVGRGPWRLAFVARSKEDFQAKVSLVLKQYRPGRRSPVLDAQGIFATDGVVVDGGPAVGLFPGQGPQYADMLRDLADEYEVVRRTIAEANEGLRERLGRTYEQLMFTASRSPEERQALEQTMTARSDIAQPVLVTASVALHRLVTAHGVRFDAFAGHSLGEYAALVCAGVLDFGQAIGAAHARGEAFRDLATRSGDAGLMATVTADAHTVAIALEGIEGYVAIANRNCPQQTVVSGDTRAVRDAVARMEAQGMECRVLPIAGAFHSRVAEAVVARMEPVVAALDVRAPATRVLSSVDLAYYEPSMDCAERVRRNLVRQLVTPVDFIGVVDRLHADGIRMFIEIGPKNALAGFVDDILKDTRAHRTLFVNHPKAGEVPQLDRFMAHHALLDTGRTPEPPVDREAIGRTVPAETTRRARSRPASGDRIWITGVSVGLPGTTSRVFSDGGLDRLLGGACFIEPVPDALQDRVVAKRITRLVKTEDGEPYLAEVTTRDDVVKLAGRRGGFSLRDDFGLEQEWLADADISYQLAVAAGLECLRDARIPLQQAHRRTSRGGFLRAGWMLPAALQDDTAVVFGSAFPGLNMLSDELGRYYRATFGAASASALRAQYLQRLQSAATDAERLQADQWFMDERRRMHVDGAAGAYHFNRNFVSNYLCMGNARFAQLVRARGPNVAVNAACCSTAAALATAEDMIRAGRARRVVVLAADDVSSDVLFEWVGAGFLAAGAAATDRNVADAAIPFDRRRHGMVVGMGAVGFVVEAEGAARERGLDPVAELLGVRLANSASHMTRPDADHVIAEMTAFLADMRDQHGLDPASLAPSLVYGSHETFTPPSGGIGAVEGRMLKQVFGDRWRDVLVVNTKCSTGHAQGASLEDAIILKGLQAGRVPPVLHTTEIDPELAGISLSTGGSTTREYALRFSAGFGSQVSMVLTKVVTRAADRTTSHARYQAWLDEVTGVRNARTAVVKRVLQVEEPSAVSTASRDPGVAPPMRVPAARPTTPAPAPVGPPRPPVVPPAAPEPALAAQAVPPPTMPAAEGAGPTVSTADITDRVMAIIEEKTGYERQYLELDLDLEADLGIDTIKQAQVMGKIRETFALAKDQNIRVKDFPTLRHVVQYVETKLGSGSPQPVAQASPAPPAPAPEPVRAAQAVPPVEKAPAVPGVQSVATANITDRVMAIVEEKTGYERQYLELDLDLEADLGVDTIKQAQVMGKIRETFALPKDQNIRVKDFPTLRHVVQYVEAKLGTDAADTSSDGGAGREGAPHAVPGAHVGSALAGTPAALPPSTPPSSLPATLAGGAVSAPDQSRAPAGALDEGVLETVLGIIEKQTGYERDELEPDLDLEADLGIDTIKQAQVMARLREAFDLPREQGIRVKDFPTIRHIVDYITSRTSAGAPPAVELPSEAGDGQVAAAPAASTPAPAAQVDAQTPVRAAPVHAPSGIGRLAVQWAPHPLSEERPNLRIGPGWTVLLTDDGLGVADALAQLLTGAGARAEILRQDQDLAAARARLGSVRAFIALHPLAADPAMAALDGSGWRAVLDRKVVATFRAIKALRSELELAAGVTAMAGPFGWRRQLADPAGSGVTGLLKSLRQEADAMLVKAVDVERPATRVEAVRLAQTIAREIERGGARVEVAYRDGTRLVPRVVPQPLDLSAPALRPIDADTVIVAFGGSRGVTAAVVKELARRYRTQLVLVGTRLLPANVAELAALDVNGLRELKSTIARGLKARVKGARPIEIERKYTEALMAIEAFRTLQACEAAGASVSYEPCDVRDEHRVRELVKEVTGRNGRIDGVIFGAGTIEDKLIEDKAPESFDRVFGVKAEGIFNVYKALEGIPLSFLAAFSSIAGRFGNRGQADYAAGNEVLARFVGLMQAARPDTRCVAFDWTGWSEVGLAARSGVIGLLEEAGLEALSPAEGARFFHEEIVFGSGPDEIVIASTGLPVDKDGQMVPEPGGVPPEMAGQHRAGVFLGAVHGCRKGAWLSASTTLDPTTDPWLRDHVIEGAPLMPAVFGIEMMVEAACRLVPGLHLWGVRDLKLHLAVKVLKDRPTTLKVAAVVRTGDHDDERIVRVQVTSDFVGPDGRVLIADRLHYTCDVRLGMTPPVAGAGDLDPLSPVSTAPTIPPLYGEGGALPHGPAFRVIERVDEFGSKGVVASVAALDEGLVLPALNGHRLLTLPFAREAAFQSAGLWGMIRHGNFGLPHGCRALNHFGAPPAGTRLIVRVAPRVVDTVRIEYDIDLIGDDGRLYDRMEGFYTVNPRAAAEQSSEAGRSGMAS